MTRRLFRLTKSHKFVLNNRWEDVRVHPKHTFFFIPKDIPCVEDWIQFLCKSHNRVSLYLHEILLEYKTPGYHTRLLRPDNMMNVALPEVMLDVSAKQHIIVLKTRKVFLNTPVHWSWFQSRRLNATNGGWYIKDTTRRMCWKQVYSNQTK